jgi:hypothetical protein
MLVQTTPGRVSESALIYNANKFSKLTNIQEYRFARRQLLREISNLERLKKCGKVPFAPVTLGLRNDKAEQHGLTTCGSIWTCPVCSSRILGHRAIEIRAAIAKWNEVGGKFILETFTLFHRSGETVAKQRSAIQAGWHKTNSGSFAKKHAKMGQVGYLRVLEVTYGHNGFHLHMHVLRFMDEMPDSKGLDAWSGEIFSKYQQGVVQAGFRAPSPRGHNFKVVSEPLKISGYFTKGFDNMPNEQPSNTVWNLATQAIANPSSSAATTWRNWEKWSKGMRQIAWSKGLRGTLGLGVEVDDQAIAEYEPILLITSEDVSSFGKLGALQARVRYHLERGDLTSLEAILQEHGISFNYVQAPTGEGSVPG